MMASSNAFTAMCSPFLTGRNFASKLKKNCYCQTPREARDASTAVPLSSHPKVQVLCCPVRVRIRLSSH